MDTIVLAMFITTMFVYASQFIKSKTNIKEVDGFIAFVQAQANYIPYAAIFVGLMLLATEEIEDRYELFQ